MAESRLRRFRRARLIEVRSPRAKSVVFAGGASAREERAGWGEGVL
jgi:hypothetical protein